MTTQEALEKSFIPFPEILIKIDTAAKNHQTVLPYVLISKESVERLRKLGYTVTENLGGAFSIPAGVSTIEWGEVRQGGEQPKSKWQQRIDEMRNRKTT
jgi:hypothetical protein